MKITALGIDLAKSVFHLWGVDPNGKRTLKKMVYRDQLREEMMQLPPCLVGLEACSGAHHWAREFQKMGHTVNLISPQFVKPYVKSNKNDFNDAEAICEAVTRPNMRFVPIKSADQQDIQMLHRMRSLMIKNRTALINQIRGLLAEYGILLHKSKKKVAEGLLEVLGTEDDRLSPLALESFTELRSQLLNLEKRIKEQDVRIARHFAAHPMVKTLMEIPGIGILTATALLVALSDPGAFKNGRHFSAWTGLVPRQHSSGGKNILLGISKRGDPELRSLLIHGGRSVVRSAALQKHPTKRTQWVLDLAARRGFNVACVAVANKNARIAWSLLAKGKPYRQSA